MADLQRAECGPPPRLPADGKTTADINGYLDLAQGRDALIHLFTSKDDHAFNLAWLGDRPTAPRVPR